ncbi:MAG: PhoX family phosphatase [Burkholderiales bacterium]|nr:PhoX family phosphatase [Burkholderiales bacterium]
MSQHHDDADDIGHNDSPNTHFQQVLDTRLSRRGLVLGGLGAATTAVLGVPTIAEAGVPATAALVNPIQSLKFTPVAKSVADMVTVPPGYSVNVVVALGDPLHKGVADYKNDGTDTDFELRSGDHHDGMDYFGLSNDRTGPDPLNGRRALLAMNHEAITDNFLHPNGVSPRPRPAAESDKEIPAHGVAVIEVHRPRGGTFKVVKGSRFNRRITPHTPAEITGPARGNALMKTMYAPDGVACRGTINNCGTSRTPWGTLLTGEENWAGYFTRNANDNTARGNDKSVTSLNRYGRSAGGASRHGWETSGADDKYRRFDISKTGVTADGTDDYRNELNTFGYMVEIDPYDPLSKPQKRTGLGRFAHESGAFSLLTPGLPLAVYMGDDSRNEYIYKWVSKATWSAGDAERADRLAVGAKYLDEGTLYVAKFNADGTGQWIALTIDHPAIKGYAGYAFADQADVVVNARLAADAVGATKMDRPEWCATHPGTGEIYFTLTNNSNRKVDVTSSSQAQVDAANPRSYSDSYAGGPAGSPGNINGHILRLRENGHKAFATAFKWDVYLFGAEAGADPAKVNLSSLTGDQDFSSPDGLWFSQATGICWIQTDDGAYTDTSNCMMLAAIPGHVGDGATKTLSYTKADGSTLTVDTPVGKAPKATQLKRFLVGARDCEITGCCETPDGKALFVNIQHPGESILTADVADPNKYLSHWPGNTGYGAGGALARPRSATVVITKDDGGRIGS